MELRNLWEWKYQPKAFSDLILNENIKPQLEKALIERPNMFLYGPPGVGKGSYVNVLKEVNDLKDCSMTINCSQDGNVETVRGKITDFVNTYSSKLKLVFLNEIDAPQFLLAQKNLRQLIEDTQKHTQWVLAVNYDQLIIPELKSRCEPYHLVNPPANEIYERLVYILKNEKISFKPYTVVELIKKLYPDIRNTVITLKQNVINKKLQETIEFSAHESLYKDILLAMKKSDPDQVRMLLRSNFIHYISLYGWLYEQIMDSENEIFTNDGEVILLIAEALHRDNVSSIKEINFIDMYFKMLLKGYL